MVSKRQDGVQGDLIAGSYDEVMAAARLIPMNVVCLFFFFSSRRRHTISDRVWSSDVCSSDLGGRRLSPRQSQAAQGRTDSLSPKCTSWCERVSSAGCAQRLARQRKKPGSARSRERSEERRVGKECRSRWWRYH